MSRFTFTTLSVLTLVVAACATEAPPLSEEDVAAIGEVREAYRQAVLATDPAAVVAVYTADGAEMPPNAPTAAGPDAIRARNESLEAVTAFQITSQELIGYGDLAVDRGTYSFAGSVEGMPGPIEDTGKYVVVLERQEDGAWRIAATIWNSDLPPAMPPEGDM